MLEALPLRVLTFNAWVLPITIPSQHKRQRLERLPEAIAALDADVVVLQEMFDVRARQRLLARFCPPYQPAPSHLGRRRIFGIVPADASGGLLVLSRQPVIDWRFLPHRLGGGARLDERLGAKGALIVRLRSPLGPITVLAVHLYAGTRPRDSRVRCRQLPHLLESLNDFAADDPVLLAGDINVSPTVSFPSPPGPDNPYTPEYRAITAAGFVDSMPPNPTPPHACVTWVPTRNRFAALPYQETKTDERYDYLMVRPGADRDWTIRDACTVLDTEDQPLSDHFGVLADLTLAARGSSS